MTNLNKKRILLVEDDDILREVLQEEFISCNYEAVSVMSGNQALKKIKEDPSFDAVVTDVKMADGDGPYLIEQIQKMNLLKNPVILMISGYSDLPTEELIKKGAHYVLAKPFELEELITITKKLIQENE